MVCVADVKHTKPSHPGTDSGLLKALFEQAQNYRDSVTLYRVEQPSSHESLAMAQRLIGLLWPQLRECLPWQIATDDLVTATIQLPDEGHVRVFHPSGAIAGLKRSRPGLNPIQHDERKVDRKPLIARAEQLAHSIAEHYVSDGESLRFESSWEWKGRGVLIASKQKPSVEPTPVALFEVLGAFRRYIGDLPVLGRASVHVGIGPAATLVRWGVDWRKVLHETAIQTAVIDPEEGARRVLGDLWWRRPERPFTQDDFEVTGFQLGYVSFSRRRPQFMMQPAWVASLEPRNGTSMGHVVAVPAAPQAFEPMGRSAMTPVK